MCFMNSSSQNYGWNLRLFSLLINLPVIFLIQLIYCSSTGCQHIVSRAMNNEITFRCRVNNHSKDIEFLEYWRILKSCKIFTFEKPKPVNLLLFLLENYDYHLVYDLVDESVNCLSCGWNKVNCHNVSLSVIKRAGWKWWCKKLILMIENILVNQKGETNW